MSDQRENWQRLKGIFEAARSLDADARAAYLAEACGDDTDLRLQADELLHADRRAATFLRNPVNLPSDLNVPPLIEGARIGPYEVAASIGSGGMGDVYKAHDHRLNRTVAIKVLRAHHAAAGAAASHFEREARAIAALNHPNVCTLYDVGVVDGTFFLVMEYLDGKTLAERLKTGPLKVGHAVEVATQVASALDTVHRAGLVHRDLKPGNIILTRGGAKLVDFGLSGLMVGEGAAGLSGALIGTVQYMAPEQLDGQIADARSDIFAFGGVLYEMIVGRKAFHGGSTEELIEAIRSGEPSPAAKLPPDVDRIVRACLAKDPDERWQTARDLLRALAWVPQRARTPVEQGGPAVRPRQRLRMFVWPLLAAAGALSAAVMFVSTRPPAAAPSAARFEIMTPLTSNPMSFALSADGRQLAFVGDANGVEKLWIRPLDEIQPRVLDGTDNAAYPFWAPDGRTLAFFADGRLKRIAVDGGAPQVIADAPNGRGGSWNRDGVIIFAPTTAGPLIRVPAGGGEPSPVTSLGPGERSHRWPQFLPDGRRFLFLSTQGLGTASGVFLGSLDRPQVSRVLRDDVAAVFTAPGRLLFPRAGTLMSATFDPDRMTAVGQPEIAVPAVGFDGQLVRAAFTASETGDLAYREEMASARQLTWFDRAGNVRGAVGAIDHDAIAAPELATRGRRVAVFRSVDGNEDVWILPIQGGIPNRFTFDPGPEIFPVWSPDERSLVLTAMRDGQYDLIERFEDGRERRLFAHPDLRIPLSFSPDGRWLLYAVQGPQTGVDLWALPYPTEPDRPPFPVSQGSFDEMAGQFSPDGRWIAYQANATGKMEIYVRAFPGPAAPIQLSSAGGSQPRWSTDGRELFYVAPDGRLNAVSVRADAGGGTLEGLPPMPLFQTRLAAGVNIPPAVGSRAQYVVTADGRFLMNISPEGAGSPPIVVSMNRQARR